MNKRIQLKQCFLIGLLGLSSQAIANDSNQYYGRGFTIVSETQTSSDLDVTVYKKITAKTVEGGIKQVLDGTGWRLADREMADPEIHRLYKQPMPEHKSQMGPIALDRALTWLGGEAWSLVIDPVNKLVSYELSESYQCFPSTKTACRGGQ